MSTLTSFLSGATAALFCLPALAQQPIAAESENPTIVAQRFTPAPAPTDFLVTFAMPTSFARGFSAGFFSDFQLNPVTVRFVFNTGDGQELGGDAVNVVSSQVVTHLMGTFALFDRVEVSLDAPFFLRQQGEGISAVGGPGQGIPTSGLGDPRLYLRARAWNGALGGDGTISVGGVGGLSLPLGDAGGFMGEGGATGSIRAVGDLHWKQLQVVGNIGYLTRPARSFLTLVIDDEIFYNVAASYQINPTIAAALELYGGANADSDIRDVDSSHLEADLAFRLQVDNGMAITGGLGTGLIAGVGNPDVRVFAGLRYQPTR